MIIVALLCVLAVGLAVWVFLGIADELDLDLADVVHLLSGGSDAN